MLFRMHSTSSASRMPWVGLARLLFYVTIGSAGFVPRSRTTDPSPLIPYAQILSIAFELAGYSLQHQLPNFEEVLRLCSFGLFR